MPRTVIGKVPKAGAVPGTDLWGPDFPRPVAAPIIKIRSIWNDEWEYRPELEFVRGNVLTSAAGIADHRWSIEELLGLGAAAGGELAAARLRSVA